MSILNHINNFDLRDKNYPLVILMFLILIVEAVCIISWHIKILILFLGAGIIPFLIMKYNELPLLLYIFCVVALDAHHFITFFEVIDFGGKSIFFTDILLGLGGIAFLIHYFNHQEKSFKTSLDVPMMLFFLVACFSLFRGFDYGKSAISDFRPYLYAATFYFITTRLVKSSNEVKKVAHIFIFSSFLIPFFAIHSHITRSAALIATRVGQSGSHSFFIMITVLFLAIYSIEVGKYKKYCIPAICCLIFLILIGYSRTTYIVFLLTFIVLALTYSKQANNLIRLAFISVMIVFIIITGLYVSGDRGKIYADKFIHYTGSVFYASSSYSKDRSLRSRLWMYEQELDNIKRHFLIGAPMGTGWQYHLDKMTEKIPMHNCHLAIPSRSGLIGYGLFLYMVILFFRRGIGYLKEYAKTENAIYMKWLLLSVFSNVIFIFFNAEMMITGTIIFMFIFIGLAEVLIRSDSREQLQAQVLKNSNI